MALRMLNSTYSYLLNQQQAVTLKGYHAIGHNAKANILPYLTGSQSFDEKVYLWEQFAEEGYLTAYAEDFSNFSSKNEQFRSSLQHMDYYFKSFLSVAETVGNCDSTGNERHQNLLESLNKFLSLHKANNYLAWWYSHESPSLEQIYHADPDYMNYFKREFEKGTFKNTLVVIGSSYGARYTQLKTTVTEQFLPLHLLVFPQWFKKHYKQLYATFQSNAENSLTSGFDMHKTLLDVLNLDSAAVPNKQKEGTKGQSLFRTILHSRTCEQAGIIKELCVCDQDKLTTQ
ncbi:uncharacterized protein [Watersipora subatra]|uniref:uncharacterized protein n=1 Tax=Watersipora subatra TaxID=2589382 RepID=UPI00355AE0D4